MQLPENIYDNKISMRTSNILKRMGIKTYEDILNESYMFLLSRSSIGKKAVKEIYSILFYHENFRGSVFHRTFLLKNHRKVNFFSSYHHLKTMTEILLFAFENIEKIKEEILTKPYKEIKDNEILQEEMKVIDECFKSVKPTQEEYNPK